MLMSCDPIVAALTLHSGMKICPIYSALHFQEVLNLLAPTWDTQAHPIAAFSGTYANTVYMVSAGSFLKTKDYRITLSIPSLVLAVYLDL